MERSSGNMQVVDRRIAAFIGKHHVLTLATQSADKAPWCCNLFYAYMKTENVFVFTSSDNTRHAQEALANAEVGASIVLESRVVGRLQGLQIQGCAVQPQGELHNRAAEAYYKRFPFARFMPAELWILVPRLMKYTDNTLGFGTKLLWTKNNEPHEK